METKNIETIRKASEMFGQQVDARVFLRALDDVLFSLSPRYEGKQEDAREALLALKVGWVLFERDPEIRKILKWNANDYSKDIARCDSGLIPNLVLDSEYDWEQYANPEQEIARVKRFYETRYQQRLEVAA